MSGYNGGVSGRYPVRRLASIGWLKTSYPATVARPSVADAHGGRLAGAVRTQEAQDLAALDLKADVIDGRDSAVALREVLDLYHRFLLP
jgi:hypothetical protein